MSMISFPYTALFLKNIGISTSLVGVVISIGAILSIIAQPFWGALSDRILDPKQTMIITVCLTAVTTLIMTLVKNDVLVVLMFLLRAIGFAPITVLFDHYVVIQCAESDETMHYGAIRIWGSISFAVTALLFGWLTEIFSMEIVFYFQSLVLFLMVWLVMRIVKSETRPQQKTEKPAVSKYSKAILNSSFVVFLFFIFMVILPDNIVTCFFPIIFEDAGGTLDLLGVSSSLRAIAEVPFFLGTAWLMQKFGSRKLMLIGAAFVLVRTTCLGFLTTPLQLLIANAFGAPAYCMLTAGMLHYVLETVPYEHRTTAQMVASSFGWSLTQVIGSSAGGFMLENYGIRAISVTGFLLVTLGVLLFVFNSIRAKRRKEENACRPIQP